MRFGKDFSGEPTMQIPPRSNKKVIYPPVGKCIYCGAADSKLTDEHIIPFSLGGLFILQQASCASCAKITGAFEGAVARSLFGNFRIKHKMPTRRPKERPSHIIVDTLNDNRGQISVPALEYPAPAFMYKCTKAGILDGLSPDSDTSSQWQIVGLLNHDEMKSFQEKYGKNTTFKFRHVPEQFARTIAKIGYSYAIAFFGTEAFRPLALDLILGQSTNLSYVVGGSFDIMPPVPDAGHLLTIEGITNLRRTLIVVNIRLFASASTPHYHVIVGETQNEQSTKRLLQMPHVLRAREEHLS
jgi:HNH endonuclease